jgi:hypothetical protein
MNPQVSRRCSSGLLRNSSRSSIRLIRKFHVSAPASKSTTTMNFGATSSTSSAATSATEAVPDPTVKALRTLFIASAIPMVGFGFMDNVVMIQAGQYIDSTVGVTFGLATLTAAAAGQVVSDVSGVVFGGSLERLLTKLKLIKTPTLSTAQRQLPLCRNVSMAGAIVGVVIGCTLGALTLLFIDLEARDRMEHATQLRGIVTDMMSGAEDDCLRSDTSTIYVASSDHFELDKDDDEEVRRTSMVMLKDAKSQTARQCADTRQVMVEGNGHTLYAPIVVGNELVAVVEFRQKIQGQQEGQSCVGFTDEDVKKAKVMARHIGIFMARLTG